jgi:hypothetical protein
MTAPGDNLEFQASAFFRDRTTAAPELLVALKDALKNRPDAGQLVCASIRQVDVDWNGEALTVIYSRRSNRISLMYIYRVSERKVLAARLKELLRLYNKETRP